MKKKENIEVVCFEWEDACLLGVEQMGKDDPGIKLAYGISCGILVKETKEFICLALDKFDTGTTPYRTLQTYPKTGMKKIYRRLFKL